MCGIAGMIGFKGSDTDLPRIIHNLANMMSFRGEDSAGIVAISGRKYWMEKGPFSVSKMMEVKNFQNIVRMANNVEAMIVHTRAASPNMGVISYDTAHPFVHEGVIGVHNGYINGKPVAFEVDSDWALSEIDKKGAVTALESFVGGYALVWWDFDLEQLRMARNESRTLYVAELACGKKIFASEALALVYAADRNNSKIKNLWETEPGVLYSFSGKTGDLVSRSEFKVKKPTVVVQPASPTTSHTAGANKTTTMDTRVSTASIDDASCASIVNECFIASYFKLSHHRSKLSDEPEKDSAYDRKTRANLAVMEQLVGEEYKANFFNACVDPPTHKGAVPYNWPASRECSIEIIDPDSFDKRTLTARISVPDGVSSAPFVVTKWLDTQPADVGVKIVGMHYSGKPIVMLADKSYEDFKKWQSAQTNTKEPAVLA